MLLYWTPDHDRKGSMNKGLSVLHCVRKFCRNWLFSILELSMVLGAHVALWLTESDFLRKKYVYPKNGPKIGFFEFTEKNLIIIFFLNLVYNESLCYLLYSCTNPVLGKTGSWDTGQDALTQSDCTIFKSTTIYL